MQKILPSNAILIPAPAMRVFKGDIFDVYQWPQTMFDGRTQTFEMLKRPDTVYVILVRDTQILLIKDEQPGRNPRVHVPQGRVSKDDESWLVTIQRELREETGLICMDWRLISVEQPLTKLEWFTPLYLAQHITEELPQELDPGGEKIELLWKDFDVVRQDVLSGNEPTMGYMVSLFAGLRRLKNYLLYLHSLDQ
jgi:8-oxo-dGTP pyrophosphatase MutT (NUDIX family)